VGYEDEDEVSVYASSSSSDSDYVELRSFLGNTNSDIFRSEGAQRLIGKMREDRSRLAMYLGYPIALRKQKSKSSNREGFMVEPIILYPVEIENGVNPRIASTFPQINFSVLKRFTKAQRDEVMDELAQLEEELGLTGESDLPEVDELCRRLAAIRSDWPWIEQPDPGAITSDPPLSQVNAEGIFNRSILVVAPRSPFTQGLEY
jgi:hypothetical protein